MWKKLRGGGSYVKFILSYWEEMWHNCLNIEHHSWKFLSDMNALEFVKFNAKQQIRIIQSKSCKGNNCYWLIVYQLENVFSSL